MSGPIQRSDKYLANLEQLDREVDETLAFTALHRIIKAFIKLAVVSALANYCGSFRCGALADFPASNIRAYQAMRW